MALKSIKDIKKPQGKKILVRVDFDVPFNEKLDIMDTTRIKACIPTIKFLTSKGTKVALLTKIGRPDGGKRISTKALVPELEKLIRIKVAWVNSCIGTTVPNYLNNLSNKEILLLENVRFYPEEKKQDMEFARKLAEPFDIYVNEAFAMCHRTDTSITLIPKILDSYAGFRLTEEYETLTKLLNNPERPFIAIIGGAKAETKIPAIKRLSKVADKVLIGGKLPFVPNPRLPKSPKIFIPLDDLERKDIGPKTISTFKNALAEAKTIVWNGPMGIFEEEKYEKGTREIAQFIAGLDAFKIIGGGDTIAAISKAGVLDKMDFVSTGGGAMLALLAGQPLPGIESLK